MKNSGTQNLRHSGTKKSLSLQHIFSTHTLRYFIQFSYNGTHYHGWQSQPNAVTVQETLEKALSVILSTEIALTGAGRTDTRVHAKVMFAHFEIEEINDILNLVHRLNAFLPKDIAVTEIFKVNDHLHARFDAVKRTYQYHISTVKDVFGSDLSWYYALPLNLDAMNQAAKILLEYTDFECFSKVNTDVNTFNCKITEAFWKKSGNELVFTISADRFLRNMVRAIVGTLVNIGQGKMQPQEIRRIIESKKRSEAGFSVPAQGLFLMNIVYKNTKSDI